MSFATAKPLKQPPNSHQLPIPSFMTPAKTIGITGMIVIGLILAFLSKEKAEIQPSISSPSREVLGEDHDRNRRLRSESDFSNVSSPKPSNRKKREEGRRELAGSASVIDVEPRPDGGEVFGVKLKCKLGVDETLVTGGNIGPDGNHEFTLITPVAVASDAVRIEMKVISLSPELIEANGLRNLSGNARSALQVAEAWSKGQTERFIQKMTNEEDSSVMSAPVVIAPTGTLYTVSVGIDGGASYANSGTITSSSTDGFSLETEFVRSLPPREPK